MRLHGRDQRDQEALVTVVVPCFNAQRTIDTAIGSVVSQTFTRWVLIVVDDGSTDASPEILSEYARHSGGKIRLVRSKNHGACHARKLAVAEATTEFIAFLDADDYWNREKLERQLDFLAKNPNLVGVTSGFKKIRLSSGRESETLDFDWTRMALEEWVLLGRSAPALNSTLLVRRKEYTDAGGHDEKLSSFADDLDLAWRMSSVHHFGSAGGCLAYLQMSAGQVHRDSARMYGALSKVYGKISLSAPALASRAMAHLEVLMAIRRISEGWVGGASRFLKLLVMRPGDVARFVGFRARGLAKICRRKRVENDK